MSKKGDIGWLPYIAEFAFIVIKKAVYITVEIIAVILAAVPFPRMRKNVVHISSISITNDNTYVGMKHTHICIL